MSPIPDDFEQLRRLLALKRHEQPPPGYFHGFSRQVIVRIKAGDLGNESEGSFWTFGGRSVFQRIWATLDARPILAGSFGVAVCGFFVVGALLSDSGSAIAVTDPNPAPTFQTRADAQLSSVGGAPPPIYQPAGGSLFDELKKVQSSPQPWQPNPQSGFATRVRVSYPQGPSGN